jgi:hypothetical protein
MPLVIRLIVKADSGVTSEGCNVPSIAVQDEEFVV